jgi:hypothetical protein
MSTPEAEAITAAMREEFARQREEQRDPVERGREQMRDTLRGMVDRTNRVQAAKLARLIPSQHKPQPGGTVREEDGSTRTITAVEDGTVTLDDGTTVSADELAPPPQHKRGEQLTREQINARMNEALRSATVSRG